MAGLKSIQIVDNCYIDKVIDKRQPEGLFLCKESKQWVAVDNCTGDAWTENFSTKYQAIFWLLNMREKLDETLTSFLYSRHLKIAVKIWAIISCPFILSTALFLRSYRVQKFISKIQR